MLQFKNLIRFVVRRFSQEKLPQVAGSLTFTTVLALVPILTIMLAIFTAFPLFQRFQQLLESYFVNNLLPSSTAHILLSYLNKFASQSMQLSAAGALALLATAVAMLSTIEQVFNQIWRIKIARSWMRRVIVYWAVLTLGPLLIGFSVSVTTYLFTLTDSMLTNVRFFARLVYTLVSFVLTTGVFTLLYFAIPNRWIAWRDALAGGVFAGVAFEIAKRLFIFYITQFPTYDKIYGAVAAVPIFLLWIYMLWLITLVGALFAAALPLVRKGKGRLDEDIEPVSSFIDSVTILKILYEARSNSFAALSVHQLCVKSGLSEEKIAELLQAMLKPGWVGLVTGVQTRTSWWGKSYAVTQPRRWVLLKNLHQLQLADVYRFFVFDTTSTEPLARQINQMIQNNLGKPLPAYFSCEVS